jgi:hypothetical protein
MNQRSANHFIPFGQLRQFQDAAQDFSKNDNALPQNNFSWLSCVPDHLDYKFNTTEAKYQGLITELKALQKELALIRLGLSNPRSSDPLIQIYEDLENISQSLDNLKHDESLLHPNETVSPRTVICALFNTKIREKLSLHEKFKQSLEPLVRSFNNEVDTLQHLIEDCKDCLGGFGFEDSSIDDPDTKDEANPYGFTEDPDAEDYV